MRGKTRPHQHRTPAGPVPTGVPPSGRHEAIDHGTGTTSAQSAELRVFVSHGSPRPVITVVGAVDICGAALVSAVLDQVRRSEGGAPEVDLSRVHYADSHGLAPLLDGQVTIRRASPVVRRLLAALDIPLPRPASGERVPG